MERLVFTSLEELTAKPKRKTLSKGMAIFEINDYVRVILNSRYTAAYSWSP